MINQSIDNKEVEALEQEEVSQQQEQPQVCDTDNVSESDSQGGDNTADVTDWRDKYLRLSAEFDNYRKRTLKEKMDLLSLGGEEMIKALLPTLDDIDRALNAIENAKDLDAIRVGVELIDQKLKDTLKSKGVAEIESIGKDLDTDFHEAVAKHPNEEMRGKIIDVVQKGYTLKDRVIRHAKVVVAE